MSINWHIERLLLNIAVLLRIPTPVPKDTPIASVDDDGPSTSHLVQSAFGIIRKAKQAMVFQSAAASACSRSISSLSLPPKRKCTKRKTVLHSVLSTREDGGAGHG